MRHSLRPGALSFVRMDDAEFAAYAAREGLVTLHPGRLEDTAVVYKNLSRFSDCFIAGSVAVERNGVAECAAGAELLLERLAGPQEECARVAQQWTAIADTFGDFKFDGLKARSGEYRLSACLPGHGSAELRVVLTESLNVGTILFRAGSEPVVTRHIPVEVTDVAL